MLAYGKTADATDAEIRMGENRVLATTMQFARTVVKVFGVEYLREPTVDTEKLFAIGEARGFSGSGRRKNCPKHFHGQF